MFSNRSWSKTALVMILMGAFLVVAACGSPAAAPAKAPDAKAPAKATDAKAPAKPAEKAAEKPTDKAKPAPPAEKGEELVANFNFKAWDKQAPHRWIADPADKVGKGAETGKNFVFAELKPSGTAKPTTVRQHLPGNLAGKSLTLTLRAKGAEPKVLSGKFSFETKAGLQTIALDAEGHDRWETITKSVSVPADAKPGSATIAVVLRPAAKKSALVNYITVTAK